MKAIYKNYFRKSENLDPILKSILNVPIFKDLSEKELNEVLKLIHERNYKKDEHVFKKMAPSEGMYVIVSGEVEILDPDTETSFASLKNNDFFGELALLDEKPRSASAIAKSPSTLIGFFRTDLLTLMKRSPELGNKILFNLSRILGERLRKTNEELTTNLDI
jgi:CRP-like cAMP-binding protein